MISSITIDHLYAAAREVLAMIEEGTIAPAQRSHDYQVGWQHACADFRLRAATAKLRKAADACNCEQREPATEYAVIDLSLYTGQSHASFGHWLAVKLKEAADDRWRLHSLHAARFDTPVEGVMILERERAAE